MPIYEAQYGFRVKGAFYRAGTKLDAPAEVLADAGVLDLVKEIPAAIEPPKEFLADKPKPADEPVKIEATPEVDADAPAEGEAETKEAEPEKNRAMQTGDVKTKTRTKGGK